MVVRLGPCVVVEVDEVVEDGNVEDEEKLVDDGSVEVEDVTMLEETCSEEVGAEEDSDEMVLGCEEEVVDAAEDDNGDSETALLDTA